MIEKSLFHVFFKRKWHMWHILQVSRFFNIQNNIMLHTVILKFVRVYCQYGYYDHRIMILHFAFDCTQNTK